MACGTDPGEPGTHDQYVEITAFQGHLLTKVAGDRRR